MQHELCIWTENTLEINSRNVLGGMSWSASLWTACLDFASLATKAQVTGTVFPENGNMFPESSRDLRSLPSFISNWAPAVKWTGVVEREKKSVFQLSSCVPCQDPSATEWQTKQTANSTSFSCSLLHQIRAKCWLLGNLPPDKVYGPESLMSRGCTWVERSLLSKGYMR